MSSELRLGLHERGKSPTHAKHHYYYHKRVNNTIAGGGANSNAGRITGKDGDSLC